MIRNFLFIVCLGCFFMVMHTLSSAEVKVTLKNNRVILADSCKTVKDNLICEKMGGTFEFDRKDILDVKEMTFQRDDVRVNSVQESSPTAEEEKSAASPGGQSGDSAKPEEGGAAGGADPEPERRLEKITERKLQMNAEREQLLREREELQQEINKAEADFPQKISRSLENTAKTTFESLRQRLADLDARTDKFSSELRSLNEEEAELLRSRQRFP